MYICTYVLYEQCKCMKLIYVLIGLIVKNLSQKDLAFISLFSVMYIYYLYDMEE